MVQIRQQITKNTKQHYMSKHKMDTIRTFNRNIMRNKEDIQIRDLLLEEMAEELQEQREFLRNDAKKNIETIQSENRKTYNKRRKIAPIYKEGDLVAIQRTQFGTGLKLRPKFLGPYKITKVNSRDRYEVEKEADKLSHRDIEN
ncbi:uncharacterized protein TNIN_224981 [Trichonephila inaurata madagascariensis]|uniref:Uncharacterized protein n=1 Tax=Trichonephila inaurata madagascariensis TaxID=2747483 RepID=A0A8X6X1J2_9ARAC|nr:uncharacterized protein TNIN_224981 [Trichonephila inaurata madagascariensis]